MKFFIPSVGTTFKLIEPWSFLLYVERRNESLFDAFGTHIEHLVWEAVEPYNGWAGGNVMNVSNQYKSVGTNGRYGRVHTAARFILPAETLLNVKRVYIRSGQKGEFDSVTLSVKETTHPFLVFAGKGKAGNRKKSLGNFWVKLCDFNIIDGEIVDDNVRRHTILSSK